MRDDLFRPGYDVPYRHWPGCVVRVHSEVKVYAPQKDEDGSWSARARTFQAGRLFCCVAAERGHGREGRIVSAPLDEPGVWRFSRRSLEIGRQIAMGSETFDLLETLGHIARGQMHGVCRSRVDDTELDRLASRAARCHWAWYTGQFLEREFGRQNCVTDEDLAPSPPAPIHRGPGNQEEEE